MKQAVILTGYIENFEKHCKNYISLLKESHIFLHTFDKINESDLSCYITEEDVRYIFVKNGIPAENIQYVCIEHELCHKSIFQQLLHRFQKRGVYFSTNKNFLHEHVKHWSALQDFFDKKKYEYTTVYLFNTDISIENMKKITDNFFIDENNFSYIIGNESILKKLKEVYMWTFYRYEMEYVGKYNGNTFLSFLCKLYF